MGTCCSKGNKPYPTTTNCNNTGVCTDNYLARSWSIVSLQSRMEVYSLPESTVSYDEDKFAMEEATDNGQEPQNSNPTPPVEITAAANGLDHQDPQNSRLMENTAAANGIYHQDPQNSKPITPVEGTNGHVELQTCEPSSSKDECQYNELRVYTFQELATATDRFSNNNSLGEGGFSQVYKGTLPITDKVVAVKKLKYRKGQRENDFEKEIRVISSARHRNLVKLYGYCNEEANKLLVLEYAPNNSLRTHLHGGEGIATLKWRHRIKIAIGSAKGLEYLHEDSKPKIIHRDVKTDNILLDAKFNPKLADFGLAKIFPDNVSITHITSHWKGTDGYTDPTDYPSQKVSDKLDVYSFGVVLLELVSGRRPMSQGVSILNWASPQIDEALKSGDYMSLLDPKLEGGYDESELKRVILCAAACVFKPSHCRPQMKQIVQALEGYMRLKDVWDVDDKTFLRDYPSRHVHPSQRRLLDLPMTIKEPIIDDIENERLPNYNLRRFTLKELEMASDGFCNSKLLKESDFFRVYMGVLPSGERVKIKYLKVWTALREDEFEHEIKAMSSIRHRNVVQLVGYCMNRARKLLVFEFVPNTLRSRLHGNQSLDWIARMKIAKGCARGLKYLLEDCNPRIIHQDINPDHIFLDDKLEPKLGDFANAKFLPDSDTHISIDTKGTSCYIAPECASTRTLTHKSNVYSYGALLLELISGILRDDFDHWVIRYQLEEVLSNRKYDAFIDPNLREYNPDEMTLLITCAAVCVREAPSTRPTMSQILRALEGTVSLNDLCGRHSRATRNI